MAVQEISDRAMGRRVLGNRNLVAAAVLAAVFITMAWHFSGEVRATIDLRAPALQAQYQRNLHRFVCLTDAAHRAVPKGSTVYLGPPSSDSQTLSEAFVGWATVASQSKAQWQIGLERSGVCGQGLAARRS